MKLLGRSKTPAGNFSSRNKYNESTQEFKMKLGNKFLVEDAKSSTKVIDETKAFTYDIPMTERARS